MSKYSELSDFEINKRVAKLTGNYGSCEPAFNAVYRSSGTQYDPINRPEQAWPIIVQFGIGVRRKLSGKWEALQDYDIENGIIKSRLETDANPLRAAMVVYLMMQEQQHDR